MKTVDLKNAAGKVKMTVLADDNGAPRGFTNKMAANIEAAKHPGAKSSLNAFYNGPHDRYYVRMK